MSRCELIEKAKKEFNKVFTASFNFTNDRESEVKKVIEFLRTAKNIDRLDKCYNWAESLADIIEDK